MFTGREYDPETGLYYYRARMYSSKIGRFLQTDPIGYYDSANLYQYAGNNPLNFTDPTGLCKEDISEKLKRWLKFNKGYVQDYLKGRRSLADLLGKALSAILGGNYKDKLWGVIPIEIQVDFDPLGGYGATFGPVILYGPSYRQLHPAAQETIRFHEYEHVKQDWWGLRDQWDRLRGSKYSSRELEAYTKQMEFINTKLQDSSLSEDAQSALESMKSEVQWYLDHPEKMW